MFQLCVSVAVERVAACNSESDREKVVNVIVDMADGFAADLAKATS